MKITKEQFDRLYSEDVSKKEYYDIISKIDERFVEICRRIVPSPRPNLRGSGQWFDYDNCNYTSENSNGYFDPKRYKLEIAIGGEYVDLPEPFHTHSYEDKNSCLTNSFPTRWLWEDFQEEFEAQVNKYKLEILKKKEISKNKQQELKSRKLKFREIIKSKLTEEELKYIEFK